MALRNKRNAIVEVAVLHEHDVRGMLYEELRQLGQTGTRIGAEWKILYTNLDDS